MDVVEDDLGLEALGVLLEARHQLGALHAVGIGRPVVDVGRRHQLPALRQTGDQHGLSGWRARRILPRCNRPGRDRESTGGRAWRACGLVRDRVDVYSVRTTSRPILTDVGCVP